MKPHEPPVVTKEVVYALKALSEGVANESQQKAALEFILIEACGIRNVSYQPGDTAGTAFAEGRRFAGLVIAGAMQAKPLRVGKRGKPEAEANDSRKP